MHARFGPRAQALQQMPCSHPHRVLQRREGAGEQDCGYFGQGSIWECIYIQVSGPMRLAWFATSNFSIGGGAGGHNPHNHKQGGELRCVACLWCTAAASAQGPGPEPRTGPSTVQPRESPRRPACSRLPVSPSPRHVGRAPARPASVGLPRPGGSASAVTVARDGHIGRHERKIAPTLESSGDCCQTVYVRAHPPAARSPSLTSLTPSPPGSCIQERGAISLNKTPRGPAATGPAPPQPRYR